MCFPPYIFVIACYWLLPGKSSTFFCLETSSRLYTLSGLFCDVYLSPVKMKKILLESSLGGKLNIQKVSEILLHDLKSVLEKD